MPRYHIPLTRLGWLALHLGFHKGLADRCPEPVLTKLRELRRALVQATEFEWGNPVQPKSPNNAWNRWFNYAASSAAGGASIAADGGKASARVLLRHRDLERRAIRRVCAAGWPGQGSFSANMPLVRSGRDEGSARLLRRRLFKVLLPRPARRPGLGRRMAPSISPRTTGTTITHFRQA